MDFKLILGYKCNLRCQYCFFKDKLTNNKDMSYKVIDKFLERFNKLEGYNSINFFGGEPLLYADKIKYIMDRIPKETTQLSISTNAVDRDTFYELENYWGKPISNLISNKSNKNYHKLNDVSYFRWIVTHENMKELTEERVKFLAYEFGKNLEFMYDLTEKWELEDVQFMENVQAILRNILKNNYKINLPVNYNIKFVCFYPGTEVAIDYNGNYLACHRKSDSILGNVFDDDFKASMNTECLCLGNETKNSYYSYGNYEFKGTTLFWGCD